MAACPTFPSHHLVIDIQISRVNAHPFYRPGLGLHTAGDMGPLKGRPGGTGTGQERFPISQNNFPISAQVDNQRPLILMVRFLGEQDPNIVGSHKPGFHRKYMDIRGWIDAQPECTGLSFTDPFTSGVNGHKPRESGVIPRKI